MLPLDIKLRSGCRIGSRVYIFPNNKTRSSGRVTSFSRAFSLLVSRLVSTLVSKLVSWLVSTEVGSRLVSKCWGLLKDHQHSYNHLRLLKTTHYTQTYGGTFPKLAEF